MKTTLSRLAQLFAVLILLGCAQSLYADPTYYFSFDGTGVDANRSVTATLVSGCEVCTGLRYSDLSELVAWRRTLSEKGKP